MEILISTREARIAYEEALRRIEECRKNKNNHLDLAGLGLQELPPEIGQLSALKLLRLDENQLSSLPPEIGQLCALNMLWLRGNQLSSLPSEIVQLSALTELRLSGNQLSSLPPEIVQLSSLAILDLSGNQLSSLPPEIAKLKALVLLDLDNNHLQTLPPEIGQLSNLQALYLKNNQLRSLVPELQNLSRLRYLLLHGNPKLKLPTTVLGGDTSSDTSSWAAPQSILSFYFARSAQTARPLNEVKLLTVGRGGVGKTSTVRALRDLEFDDGEESTKGIALCDWPMHDCKKGIVTAHIWDFAGQVITHALHQFFFSERSMYLLVLSGREDNALADAEYWLRLIMAFGKDENGKGPPVIISLNKWEDIGCRAKLDRAALQERYPCICAFIETDCQSGRGIDKLKKALAKEADKLAWVHQDFPARWDEVRHALNPGKKKRPHLPFSEFRALCTRHHISETMEQEALADVLHNLGIALNYRRDPRLREATILQPDWLTENVYKLLRQAEKQRGILTLADSEKVLRAEKEPAMRDFLRQLMERFEVAYVSERDGQEVWLLPQALPDNQPKAAALLAAAQDATSLRYTYPALPEGLLARAIVRLHEFIEHDGKQHLQWASGVILTMEGARALLRAVSQDRQIVLTVTGETEARRRLAGLVRSEMRDINHSIHGLEVQEETREQGQWLNTETVEADEKQGQKTPLSLSGQATQMIDPVPVNNAYSSEEARRDTWKPKIFISYSKHNVRQRESLARHLRILANLGLCDHYWHDRMILPGDDWHESIQTELNDADLIVILLSSDALGTDYIRRHEIPHALQLREQGTEVVPIILEDCSWDKTPLAALNALPEKGKPINEWRPNQKKGWKSVEDGLAKVLQKIKDQAGARRQNSHFRDRSTFPRRER